VRTETSRTNSPDAPKRILIAGTFDVANYGDVLFPLIAERRLKSLGIDTVPVSPAGTPTAFADAMPVLSVAAMLTDPGPIDGVLIGGGYIVHQRRFDFLREYQDAEVVDWAYPGLWLGATLIGALHDVPVVWNAPGVLFPFSRRVRDDLIAPTLRAADYVSVRDQGSADLLGARDGVDVAVVPDTVIDLARLWPRERLDAPFQALLQRKSAPADGKYLAVHMRALSTGGLGLAVVADWITAFVRAQGLTPILVAIGPSLGDAANACSLAAQLGCPHVLLDDPKSLLEVAAAIGCSELYVGASFHGYVTAAAYGKPGVIVARPAYKKFAGFLSQTGRPQDMAHDWEAALDTAATLLRAGAAQRIPQSVHDAADRHWERVVAALADPTAGRQRRRDFLKAYAAYGVAHCGPGWLLAPGLPSGRALPNESAPDAAPVRSSPDP
jgi:hypothetical protein